jgi:GNAT superfamily N-acetyltransferase
MPPMSLLGTSIGIRRDVAPGDAEAVVALHARVYLPEYGLDWTFVKHVAASVTRAVERGWPSEREGIWLVERAGATAGSIGLTDEGGGEAALRWFVLEPELRGSGLGRRLLGEVLATAADQGYERIGLETFSELCVAAHLYREHGFELMWSDRRPRWGRSEITYQRYELALT